MAATRGHGITRYSNPRGQVASPRTNISQVITRFSDKNAILFLWSNAHTNEARSLLPALPSRLCAQTQEARLLGPTRYSRQERHHVFAHTHARPVAYLVHKSPRTLNKKVCMLSMKARVALLFLGLSGSVDGVRAWKASTRRE